MIPKQSLIVASDTTRERSPRISSALLLSPKNILHKVLDPAAPDDALYVTLNTVKRP